MRRYHYLSDRCYTTAENLKRYGQKDPPPADLSAIHSVPIAVLAGKYDKLSPPKDAEWIQEQIKLAYFKIYDSQGHLTFQVAKDMSYLDDVDRLIKEYSS